MNSEGMGIGDGSGADTVEDSPWQDRTRDGSRSQGNTWRWSGGICAAGPPNVGWPTGRASCTLPPKAARQGRSRGAWGAAATPSGARRSATKPKGWTPPCTTGHGQDAAGGFSPRTRVRIQALAGSPPSTHGLALIRWSVRELTRITIAEGIVETSHL